MPRMKNEDILKKQVSEKDIEVGQWHQLQMQIDAYRSASSLSIEAMRDAYRKELGDFVQYNESWKSKIDIMYDKLLKLNEAFGNMEMQFNELAFKVESVSNGAK